MDGIVLRGYNTRGLGRGVLRRFWTLVGRSHPRTAILLLGGDKTGGDRWYEVHVPLADRLYDEHLAELRTEGLIDG